MPSREYTTGNTSEFNRFKQVAAAVKAPAKPAAQAQAQAPATNQPMPAISVSGRFRDYSGSGFTVSHPDNWEVLSGGQSGGVTIAPREGVVEGGGIGLGAVIGRGQSTGNLRNDTDALTKQLTANNPGMRAVSRRTGRVDGNAAMLVTLNSQSPWAGETEVDTLVAVERPDGLFYMVLIAPQSAQRNVQSAFDTMIRSLRFAR